MKQAGRSSFGSALLSNIDTASTLTAEQLPIQASPLEYANDLTAP